MIEHTDLKGGIKVDWYTGRNNSAKAERYRHAYVVLFRDYHIRIGSDNHINQEIIPCTYKRVRFFSNVNYRIVHTNPEDERSSNIYFYIPWYKVDYFRLKVGIHWIQQKENTKWLINLFVTLLAIVTGVLTKDIWWDKLFPKTNSYKSENVQTNNATNKAGLQNVPLIYQGKYVIPTPITVSKVLKEIPPFTEVPTDKPLTFHFYGNGFLRQSGGKSNYQGYLHFYCNGKDLGYSDPLIMDGAIKDDYVIDKRFTVPKEEIAKNMTFGFKVNFYEPRAGDYVEIKSGFIIESVP